ncbi:MAG: hypothetical protein KDC98_22425 [Planctomycetes bacterium]|nr:hypothetical protein [Planctomycetota bacterium]
MRRTEARPFAALAHVRIDSFEPLRQWPVIGAIGKALERQPGADPAAIGGFVEAVEALPRPLELDLTMIDAQNYAVVLRLPSRERRVLPLMAKNTGVKPQETAFDGGAVGRCMTPFGMLFEAVIGDTDHCVLFEGRAARSADAVTWMTRHFGSMPTLEPAAQSRWDALAGGGVRCYVATRRLLPAGAKLLDGPLLQGLLGDSSLDVGLCLRMDKGHVVTECLADIGARGSMLGDLAKGAALSRLVAWLPPDAQEFMAYAVDVDAVDALLELPVVKASLAREPSLRALHGFLTGSWDGHCATVSKPVSAADALDADAEVPIVLLLGAEDAPKALTQALRGFETRPVEDLKDSGTAVAMVDENDAPVLLFVARGDVIWAAGADPGSRELLRASLATAGRGSLPSTFLGRLTSPLPAATLGVVLSSDLGKLADRVMLRQLTGRRTSDLEREIAEALQHTDATYAMWIAVDGSGLHCRVTY